MNNNNDNIDDLKELNIAELFNPDERYIIPIYQRNYAWGATEVEQLIQDIYDAALLNNETESEDKKKAKSDYFIGSLVVHLRDNGSYETIDGQQRHTTLSILLAVLKNSKVTPIVNINQTAINLHFDSRPKSERTLAGLYDNKPNVELEEPVMVSAYKIAERYIEKEKIDLAVFSQYLLNQVKILRVKVPEKTDLNHYFEIMNNRGEQLEKHEVLKARMMGKYKNDDVASQSCFSSIWDACADMHRYVQLGFDKPIRNDIFGGKWSRCPSSFEAIKACFVESKNNSDGMFLSEIITKRQYSAHSDVNDEETEKDERFNSVIDFPNFLLQVLSVNSDKKVALDDKQLLTIFADTDIDATTFIMQLLKCRMLFDKYIIKRDNSDKDRWSLLSLVPTDESFSYNNTVGKEEEIDKVNEQLVMILSMFHVSYPTNARKRWLTGALSGLLKLAPTDDIHVAGDKYLSELEQLSDRYFEEITAIKDSDQIDNLVYQSKEPENDDCNQILHTGTAVQNFIFNRLDYLLWLNLRDGFDFQAIDAQINIGYIKERLNEFKFSFRTSVEHHFPQTNPWGKAPMDGVDRFGNLCLITPSSNSKLSNYSPEDKKKYYEEKGRSESLKQTFMMSYEVWSPEEQGLENIKSHERMMIKVLFKEYS